MENPYLGLYELMGKATKVEPSFFIAKIKAPLPNLEIQLNDIVLDKDDVLIDKSLLLANDVKITSSSCSIEHNLKDNLNINDKVILLKVNDKFIVLSKVVSI